MTARLLLRLERRPIAAARGFALVAAIFLLVIIAAMGAFAVGLSANAHSSSAGRRYV